jgi:3-oxo-5-alpha-steroid 4-dehydrogenase 1
MSPIHISVWASALSFQLINATCIGGWLAGFGPATEGEWLGRSIGPRIEVGIMIFAVGLLANIYHDDELREIRRAAARSQKKKQEQQGEKGDVKSVDKVYLVPENGLFRVVLFPHYLCEWIEWCGFYMVGGLACVPARIFVINEVATMLPRALQGKHWYIERFGREKIGSRKAVIPGII